MSQISCIALNQLLSQSSALCGIDEAGRGPLAGPVVAGAVIFPPGYTNALIKDSKQLSAKRRDELAHVIKADALHWSVVAVGHCRIDRINIREATRLAMRLAVERVPADGAIIDGNVPIDITLPQCTVVKGDQLFVQISAASILAKTYRDALMHTLDRRYPGYGLAGHAGYPTASHRAAIQRLGASPIHRRTFGGVKEFLIRDDTKNSTPQPSTSEASAAQSI